MMDWVHNLKLNFGAKYIAEDTASYILYQFDRSSLDGRAVSMERFARFLGLDVLCEYVSDDGDLLGVAAFEPQRIELKGGAFDLPRPAVIVERDIIERGESGLYNYALALLCAEALFYAASHEPQPSAQLSFFSAVPALCRKEVFLTQTVESLGTPGSGVAGFAQKLVLPKNGFKRQTVEQYARHSVNRATVEEKNRLQDVLTALAAQYNVPEFAVLGRLRELNLY